MSALSAVYGGVARLRRSWYERHPHIRRQLDRPVISVGNLSVGGSGKTPVVKALAQLLMAMGERPAILTRGYARKHAVDGVVVVSDRDAVLEPVERSGDEPQMLARALPGVPVLVSPDRHLAGCLAERRFDCTVLVLDDGFQHLQLARDIDLLLVSPSDLEDQVLPSGRLREPLQAARAADGLLVPGTADQAGRVSRTLGVEPVFAVSTRVDMPRVLGADGGGPLTASQRRVVAVAGIAKPARFFSTLRSQGWDVVREIAFPDHHWFSARDIARVAEIARQVDADLVVTTEKDAVRLEPWMARSATSTAGDLDGTRSALGMNWAALPMDAIIEPTDVFASWIRERL